MSVFLEQMILSEFTINIIHLPMIQKVKSRYINNKIHQIVKD